MENRGVFIDRSRQAGWWLGFQKWNPSNNWNEATELVLGVQGSVEGEGSTLGSSGQHYVLAGYSFLNHFFYFFLHPSQGLLQIILALGCKRENHR